MSLTAEKVHESFTESLFKSIWVVSYRNRGNDPVITVFDNEEAANKCYNHFKNCYDICCLDKCPIYSTFVIS